MNKFLSSAPDTISFHLKEMPPTRLIKQFSMLLAVLLINTNKKEWDTFEVPHSLFSSKHPNNPNDPNIQTVLTTKRS